MISKTAVRRETERRLRRLNVRNGEELRRLRIDAGVSLREVAAVTGLHPSFLARIEAAKVQGSIPTLTRIGIALGAELSLRFYAGSGPSIHDRFQAPMLECLIREIHHRWRTELEVGVTRPARGVIDVVLDDPSRAISVAGDVQSEIRRLEEQIRWLAEKAEGLRNRLLDHGSAERVVSKLLILRSTKATREIARRYAATLHAAYPARTSDVVDALTGDAPWPGDGIVWMRLERGDAELLRHPPRGVALGR